MTKPAKITVSEIANVLRAELVGSGHAPVTGVSAFDTAGADNITFAYSL